MSSALYGNSSTWSRLLENLKPWGFPRREDAEKFLQEKKPKGLSKGSGTWMTVVFATAECSLGDSEPDFVHSLGKSASHLSGKD